MMSLRQAEEDNKTKQLGEIAISCLKLGIIGFGGIAGMVATIENEIVVRRKWIDHQHFMDVLSTSYIIPGPNAVEVVMHCGKERGGRLGLVVAGVCYIFPAMLICLLLGYCYQRYSTLPNVEQFIFGIRPATTALVAGTVFRLSSKTVKGNPLLISICLLVFAGSLWGVNEIFLIVLAGLVNWLVHSRKDKLSVFSGLFFLSSFSLDLKSTNCKLFLIFLKIGAVLYGSGYVLFAYMDDSLVRNNHWLTRQQLADAIAVGQITPGPILSSATFAGYIIGGTTSGVLATIGIFLPSFFISFFLHKIISSARKSTSLRVFLDGLSAASISVIAAVGIRLFTVTAQQWQGIAVLSICLLSMMLMKQINALVIMLIGSTTGILLLSI